MSYVISSEWPWPLATLLAVTLASGCTSPNPSFDPSLVDGQPPADTQRPPSDASVDEQPAVQDLEADRTVQPDVVQLDKPVGVDVLFVIDNSPGMFQVQQRLARDVDSLLSRLDGIPGGPNYRVGVVTADMGVGPYANKSCSDKGDRGRLFIAPDCPKPAGGKSYIERVADTANVPDVDSVLSCLVVVGDEGCGFEQPLEAMHAATVGGANAGFIRPDAALAIVILGNEDDCSAADQQLYDPYAESFGPYASYRCFQFGVLCGGDQPPSHPDLLTNCAPGQTWLHPIKARYVDPLVASKPPGWVFALAIAGPVNKPIQVVAAENYQGEYWRVAPSCTSDSISGDPALRLDGWSKDFATQGGFESVCADSYRQSLVQLAARIRTVF